MSADVWNALANWILALSAAGASVAAIRGLNTWRRQGEWDADADLSRRLLIAIYKYRDSVETIRRSTILPEEQEMNEVEAKEITAESEEQKGLIHAFVRRWEKHSETRRELDALVIEAEALWGNELRDLIKALKGLERELFDYTSIFLDAYHRGGDPKAVKRFRQELHEMRYIWPARRGSDPDEFREDFARAMTPIEEYLRSKLGRETQ